MSAPGFHRWILLAYGVVMQAMTIGISTYSFAFFVVPWMREFDVLRSSLMIAATGATIGTAFLSPVCGMLLDRFSSRTLVIVGAGTFSLGLAAIAMAPSAVAVILLFVLVLPFGMVLSGTLMASTLVARSFSEGRGLALGISALGTSLGGLVMPLLVTQILASFDWRVLFNILAGLVIALVIVPAPLVLRSRTDAPGEPAARAHAGPKFELMRSPSVLKLGLAFLVPSLLFVAVLHNLGALAADLSISQQHAAWIASTASLVMMIGKVITGFLCDRVDHRLLYMGIVMAQAIGVSILCLAASFAPLLIAVVLLALGAGGGLPVITSFAAGRWGPENFGSMMGVVFALAGLTGVGSVLAGVIRDASGSYVIAFLGLMLALVPAAWCFITLSRSSQSADSSNDAGSASPACTESIHRDSRSAIPRSASSTK